MEILNLSRGSGKTTYCVYRSAITGYPILCYTYEQKKHIKEQAKILKRNIPEPILISEFSSKRAPQKIIVDEIPHVLQAMLGVEIDTATLTDTYTELADSGFNKYN